ncbi:MAG: AAA family ATPase [Candidatus Hydrogenedentota bacterium]
MYITHLTLRNWRNFREVEAPLRERTYLLGPNASGKSNLLDVFRFLRDVSKPEGGGLQKAVADRGGMKRLRCLHARRQSDVRIEVALAQSPEESPIWQYVLGFKSEGTGRHRTLITEEHVRKNGEEVIRRPTPEEETDPYRLTQTYLEQIQMNAEFRELAEYFASITYLHLVPQLLRYNTTVGGKEPEEDPFGQGFLQRLAKTPKNTRDARLKRIEKALAIAVPQFKELKFEKDEVTGQPHLSARYAHHRPKAGWQREEDFSDGTLRLIGLLWSLLESESLLLLEEPELSLNDAIVREIPRLFEQVQAKKGKRQVVISTHSDALLSNKGIDGRGVLKLEPGPEGTTIRSINDDEAMALRQGLSVAEVILPKTKPEKIGQQELW